MLAGHLRHRVVDALIGFDPLIEEPVEVHVREGDDALAEVFWIRVAHVPLIEVVLHGRQEEGVSQHVLQVVQHGSRLEVDMPIPTSAFLVARELVAMRVDRGQ